MFLKPVIYISHTRDDQYSSKYMVANVAVLVGWSRMPSCWNRMPSDRNRMPSEWNKMPSGWNRMPRGWNRMPSGWNRMPSEWKRMLSISFYPKFIMYIKLMATKWQTTLADCWKFWIQYKQ